jgi:hypothetical protein
MSMSTFQWVVVVGLGLVILQLFYTVKAVLAVAQTLQKVGLGEEENGGPASLSDALYRIVGGLIEIEEQAKRLADCYARATHDPIEVAKAEQEARLIEQVRTEREADTDSTKEPET